MSMESLGSLAVKISLVGIYKLTVQSGIYIPPFLLLLHLV